MDVYAKHNITIVDEGSGPTILLVHGFGCDQNLWRPVVDRLKSAFRLVLIDLVGSGSSDPAAWDPAKYSSLSGYAADILDVVDELHLRDVVFVGHSVSAMIGALATLTDPSRFAKLVMLTPSPCYIDDGDYHGGFSRADIDELLESLGQNYLGWSRAMAPVIMGTPDRPDLADELADTFCRTDPECARVFARTTFLSDNRADLARIPLPTLVIECSRGRHRPARGGRLCPRARPGKPAGHAGCDGTLPARQCPGRNRIGDSELCPDTVTDRSVENFWNTAPSGHVIAHPDGRIIRANATLARWLGYEPKALCDRAFTELLTVAGRILYDTHFGPLLGMGGDLNGVAVDVVTADGTRLPMFLTANVTAGADGKPELLQITVVDASNRRAYERELLAARQQAQTEQGRVRVFAETLRRALLPPLLSPPDGLEAADYYFTASDDDVGGDFYDLFPLTRTTWGFFLGDVAGKGAEAAVVTSLIRYTLRAAAVFDDDPVEVLHNLNTVINQKLRDARNRFSTLVYGKMTQRDNGFDVELASGGHPPPLLFYADGSAYYADTIGGQAVGITAEPHFVACRFRLGPGDTLMLYTDGLTEAGTGIGHERYDDEGALLRFAKTHAPTTASAIVDAARLLLEGLGAGVQDDAAVLAMGVPRHL